MSPTHQDPAAPSGASTPPPTTLDVELVVVQTTALTSTYRASELLGRDVLNESNEVVGKIDDLLIADDRLSFAILSVGGLLGIGAHRVVIAFGDLLIRDNEVVLPGASKESLKRMLKYDPETLHDADAPLRLARRGVKDTGEVVATATGELIPGAVAEVTDGDP